MSLDSELDRMAEEDEAAWKARVTGPRRLYRTAEPLPGDRDYDADDPDRIDAEADDATLVGSRVGGSVFDDSTLDDHMPVIDLDLPCSLLPSTTPGHYHLYIDHKMPFSDMIKLLTVMEEVGIVQPGFLRFTLERGEAFVRYPGVTKFNEGTRVMRANRLDQKK